jgi:ferredoxin-type protein NapG
MDRREFFRRSVGKAAETVTRHVDKRVNEKAAHWIRPPFALPELEFLLACTRCSDCISACPHQVIFPLSARLGADVAGTPALDLLNKGCHLCDDWPCVNACETGAMKSEQDGDVVISPRPFAKANIDTEKCLPYTGPECGACAHSCSVEGALIWESEKPSINPEKCVGCGMCREACIVAEKAISITSLHM